MKNLKKVLALGLALVMMLGMFTVASAAETKKTAQEFTDWASVSNKDAVSLMVDLGVINGLPDGTYAPAQTIDRASWAKMVFFVLTGETNGDIYASDYPVLKDIAKNWAQGYIEYLYSIDCISGDNLGNYNPSQPISVVAAAKTMLTGLGYNSKIEGYEADANWATNIMSKAKAIGLMKGISLKQNENISRDAAAQMVYNALSAQTVTAKYQLNFMTGERVPSGEYEKGDTLGEKAFDVVKVTTSVDGVSEKGVATLGTIKDADGKTVSPKGEVKASLKDMGKNVTLWVKSDYSEFVSTSVASAALTPIKVDTDGVVWAKALKDNPSASDKKEDDFAGEPDENVSYFKNGDTSSTSYVPVVGDVVEYYDTDDNGKIDVVHVYAYTAAKLSGDPASKTDKDGNTTVDLKITGLGNKIPAEQITGDWASMKKGDIVLYYANSAKTLVTVEKAEVVNGKITNKSAKSPVKITVNGTQYGKSGKSLDGLTAFDELAPNKDNEYDFYLDKNGSIFGATLVEGEVETKVAYVLDAAWVVPTASGLSQAGDAYIEAKLLFTDATTEIVKVVKVGEDKTKDMKTEDARTAALTKINTELVDYSVDGADYTVTAKEAEGTADITAESEISAKPGFSKTDTNLTANNSTVFLVEKVARKDGAKDGDAVYSVYTGYKNVPATTAVEGTTFSKDGFVTYAFISVESFNGEGSEGLVYIKDSTDYSVGTTENVYTYYNVVDAKGNVLESMDVNVKDGAPAETGFYTVKSTTDGVSVLEKSEEALVSLDSIGGGVVKTTSTYSYDESSVCVIIDTSDELTASSFDPDNFSKEDDKVYNAVVIAKDGVVDYIYVVVTAAAAE